MTMPSIITKILRDYFRWVILVVVAIILGLGYGLLLNKKIARIQTISFSDKTRAQSELDTATKYASDLQVSLDSFQKSFNQTDLVALNQVLPTSTEFPDLLLSIKQMATISNLELAAITINASGEVKTIEPDSGSAALGVAPAKVQSIDISLQFNKGTGYEQFKSFLGIIESSKRIYDVQSLSFSEPSGKEGTATPITLILRTYVLPDEAPTT